jgi:hypothetical protein
MSGRAQVKLTCVLGKLFQELIPVPVFGDVVGYRHAQFFSFP